MKKNDHKNKTNNNKNKNKPNAQLTARNSKASLTDEKNSTTGGKDIKTIGSGRKKGGLITPTGSRKCLAKSRYVEGEEIEGVTNYKITACITQTSRPLAPDVYAVKDSEEEENRMKICNLELGILKKEAALLKKLGKLPGTPSFLTLIDYGTILLDLWIFFDGIRCFDRKSVIKSIFGVFCSRSSIQIEGC
ncbi:unnamed protein product [Caenorhabditis angaria]|uniref:Uncharacterized protein n=1 Tax=Caenorhabditis angaria TaxID=860376 RepID=A0A9P1IW73_9PELO|nr:unnamed protein product [Caenorhabditis angaria]